MVLKVFFIFFMWNNIIFDFFLLFWKVKCNLNMFPAGFTPPTPIEESRLTCCSSSWSRKTQNSIKNPLFFEYISIYISSTLIFNVIHTHFCLLMFKHSVKISPYSTYKIVKPQNLMASLRNVKYVSHRKPRESKGGLNVMSNPLAPKLGCCALYIMHVNARMHT